jgi:hypothetical protein
MIMGKSSRLTPMLDSVDDLLGSYNAEDVVVELDAESPMVENIILRVALVWQAEGPFTWPSQQK